MGVVTALVDSGLILTLLAVDDGPARDIDQLKISVCLCYFCCVDIVQKLSSSLFSMAV